MNCNHFLSIFCELCEYRLEYLNLKPMAYLKYKTNGIFNVMCKSWYNGYRKIVPNKYFCNKQNSDPQDITSMSSSYLAIFEVIGG